MKTLELKQMEGIDGGWKIFGTEITGSIGVNELMCPGSNGVIIFSVTYVFGIPFENKPQLICN